MSERGEGMAQMAADVVRGVLNAAYSDTVMSKVAQGATEISNALFSESPAYSPVTADKASDSVHRAQYQNHDENQGLNL